MKKIAILTLFIFAFFPLMAGAQQYDPDYNGPEAPQTYDQIEDEPQAPEVYDQTGDEAAAPRGYYGDEDVDEEPDYDYEPGDMDFTIVGSGSSDNDFNRTNFNTQGTLGFFMSEYLELFFRQGFGYVDVEGGDDRWIADSRLGLDIVFDLNRLKPFIGGSAGYLYSDADIIEDQWIAGPEAGLKFFATDTAYLYGMMEYQFLFDDADDVDNGWDDGRYVYSIGVGFKF